MRTPFLCSEYGDYGLDGLGFTLLSLVGDGTEQCVLGGRPRMRKDPDGFDSDGDGCTYNALTKYFENADVEGAAAQGINLVRFAFLLFTPTRTPPLVIPSIPILEEPMVRGAALSLCPPKML